MVRKIIRWLLSDKPRKPLFPYEAQIRFSPEAQAFWTENNRQLEQKLSEAQSEAEKYKNWYRFAFRSGFERGYASCELEMLYEQVEVGIEHRRSKVDRKW